MQIIRVISEAYRMGIRRGGLRWLFFRYKGREDCMSYRRQLADAITSAVEDMKARKILTDSRAEMIYEDAARCFGLENYLRPRSLKGDALKKAIRWRLYSSNGDYYNPVPLPGRRRSLSEIMDQAKPPF